MPQSIPPSTRDTYIPPRMRSPPESTPAPNSHHTSMTAVLLQMALMFLCMCRRQIWHLIAIAKASSPRTSWHVQPLICASATFSPVGREVLQMDNCGRRLAAPISRYPLVNTTLVMQASHPATLSWCPIVVYGIICANGNKGQLGMLTPTMVSIA